MTQQFITVPFKEGGTVQAVRADRWTSMLLEGADGSLSAGVCVHANIWSATIIVLDGEQLDSMIEQLSVHRMHMRAKEEGKSD